jgi:hypothetical protein
MHRVLVSLVIFATAVHTVFGCCWHHAHAAPRDHGHALGAIASGCACDSQRQGHLPSDAACRSEQESSAAEVEQHAFADGAIQGAAPRESECDGGECVWLLPEKSENFGKATDQTPAGPVFALAAEPAPSVAPGDGRGERLLVYEVLRPVRTHLWLQILLI